MTYQARERERHLAAPTLALGHVVPSFASPRESGAVVRLRDYKGRRNLVLCFMHSTSCVTCVNRLRAFAGSYREYQDLDAEILAISPDAQQAVEMLAADLRLPFPLLVDATGEVSARYTGVKSAAADSVVGILVTDRYGALYHQTLSRRDADLPDQRAILGWLLFVGIQCEECGMPEWPAP